MNPERLGRNPFEKDKKKKPVEQPSEAATVAADFELEGEMIELPADEELLLLTKKPTLQNLFRSVGQIVSLTTRRASRDT